MKNYKYIINIVILALMVMFTEGCISKEKKFTSRFFMLDTVVDVTFFSKKDGEKILSSLSDEIHTIDSLMSISSPHGDIYKINHRNNDSATVKTFTMSIIKFCLDMYYSSDSLFDVTVAPLKYLYGLESHQEKTRVPSQGELDSLRSVIGAYHIKIVNDSVLHVDSGVTIDLGGIVKGYVIKRVKDYFSEAGIENYLVNLGGDLIAWGEKPGKQQWNIGIKNPRPTGDNEILATLQVKNITVFSSGDYERYFIVDSVRYHHIFNPKTLKPERKNQHSTVLGEDPLKVDVCVKIAFLMDAPDALEYLKRNSLQGLLVDSTGTIWASAGLKDVIKPMPGFVINYQ